jgi:hypothetical protein
MLMAKYPLLKRNNVTMPMAVGQLATPNRGGSLVPPLGTAPMAQSVSDLRRFKDALTQVRVLVPACSGYLFQSLLPGGIAEPSAFLETMPSISAGTTSPGTIRGQPDRPVAHRRADRGCASISEARGPDCLQLFGNNRWAAGLSGQPLLRVTLLPAFSRSLRARPPPTQTDAILADPCPVRTKSCPYPIPPVPLM